MPQAKKTAIDLDEIQGKAFDQVSAADFITALNNSCIRNAAVMCAWPEKRMYTPPWDLVSCRQSLFLTDYVQDLPTSLKGFPGSLTIC